MLQKAKLISSAERNKGNTMWSRDADVTQVCSPRNNYLVSEDGVSTS